MNNQEIELKYLINCIPDICKDYIYIDQYYFKLNSENEKVLKSLFPDVSLDEISTFRIRDIISESGRYYVVTLKTKGTISRNEYEVKTKNKNIFDLLTASDVTSRIIKNRYIYKYDNYTYEFDEYLNLNSKLYTVEVEFDSIDDLNNKKPLIEKALKEFFKVNYSDVTFDNRYKNSNLHKYF